MRILNIFSRIMPKLVCEKTRMERGDRPLFFLLYRKIRPIEDVLGGLDKRLSSCISRYIHVIIANI